MKACPHNGWSKVQSDLMLIAGSGALLSLFLFGLYTAFHAWYSVCAAMPTPWNVILGLQG